MFRVSQRVKPSQNGIEANLFPGAKAFRLGTVMAISMRNYPTVLWDERKKPGIYHPDFIEAAQEGRTGAT